MELRCASSFDCAHEIAAPSASRNAQQDNRRQEQRTKTHGLRRFATNFTSSVAKDSHRCALCPQSRLWGFHRWRAVENMAAKERQNPVPGCSIQVSGLQVGSRVIYLDVLGISWHILASWHISAFQDSGFMFISLSPTTFWCWQGRCQQQSCAPWRSPQCQRR